LIYFPNQLLIQSESEGVKIYHLESRVHDLEAQLLEEQRRVQKITAQV
jgi:hypothetical protein